MLYIIDCISELNSITSVSSAIVRPVQTDEREYNILAAIKLFKNICWHKVCSSSPVPTLVIITCPYNCKGLFAANLYSSFNLLNTGMSIVRVHLPLHL